MNLEEYEKALTLQEHLDMRIKQINRFKKLLECEEICVLRVDSNLYKKIKNDGIFMGGALDNKAPMYFTGSDKDVMIQALIEKKTKDIELCVEKY